MGTSGTPTTIRLALGRSLRLPIPAGFPLGTTRTGSFRANTFGPEADPASNSACMCFRSALANTSAGAPFSICVRSSCEPARLKTTRVPTWDCSNCRPSAANASRSEDAAKTASSRAGSARAASARAQASPRAVKNSRIVASVTRNRHRVNSARQRQLQLGDQVAGLPRVVAAQARQLPPEGAPLERLDDPHRADVCAPFLGEGQVEPLLGQRDEIEAVSDGGAAGDDPGVSCPHGDRLGHLKVAAEQALVAFDRGGGDPGLSQETVEQPARACARLPVDEADPRLRDVFGFADAQWVP